MPPSWDRLPAAARRRAQDALLAEWLASEVEPFSLFWRGRLGGLAVRTVDDLVRAPVTEERELAAAGGPGNPGLLLLPTEDEFKRSASRRELVAAAREVRGGGARARRAAIFRRYKPVHVHEAGVSVVLAVAYTRTDLDRLHLAGARLAEVLGLGADDALVNAVPAGPTLRFWGLYHAALAARMTALHPLPSPGPAPDAVARALAMLPATALAVPARDAGDLLAGLTALGVRAPRLRTVLVVGEPPTPAGRLAVAEAAARVAGAAVRVQAVWAPLSARALWGECRPPAADPPHATYGLHTYPDLEVLEVRDPATGARVRAQQPGELVYTSVGWRGTAMVRAATGAWTGGMVEDVACPSCGRTVPRLAPDARDDARSELGERLPSTS